MKSTSRSGLERGQGSVEALLAILVLVVILFGGVELAQGVSLRSALDSSASAAARALSLDPGQWTFAAGLIQESVNRNVMGEKPVVTLRVYDRAGTARSAGWLADLPFGETFILEATAPFDANIPLLTTSPVTIQVRHWGVVERYP